VGSFPGFSMDTTQACFHADGKYCLRKTVLNTFIRKVIARLGRCLRTLFGTVRARSLANLETTDGLLDLRGTG
jgi:hypothetical protein